MYLNVNLLTRILKSMQVRVQEQGVLFNYKLINLCQQIVCCVYWTPPCYSWHQIHHNRSMGNLKLGEVCIALSYYYVYQRNAGLSE